MVKCVKVTVKCRRQTKVYLMYWKIKADMVSDGTNLVLRSLAHKDLVLGVYCGLGLDAGVCGGTERGREGGRGMVVLATSCCYLEHDAL